MDAFYEHLLVRASTIDELLSDDFEILPGQKGDSDVAAQRLASWCRSSASGDWALFSRRLERDQLSFEQVLARFATIRRKVSAPTPKWVEDAGWVDVALQSPSVGSSASAIEHEPYAFEHLFVPVVEQAYRLLCSSIDARAFNNLAESACIDLRRWLMEQLSDLFAPALYDQFAEIRKAAVLVDREKAEGNAVGYDYFVAKMKTGGFRRLFIKKPVLLRLAATIVRQWIDVSGEFINRLDADLGDIRRKILFSTDCSRVASIESDLSDPHNHGHSVLIIHFEDGARVVYKPKDLRLDVAWHALIGRLNQMGPPSDLKALIAIAREGYGWTSFISHAGCDDLEACGRFFRRAGSLLALFHCFAANDIHQENLIAAGEYPVPIDLETLLQAEAEEQKSSHHEALAIEATGDIITNSVTMVGMLPAYAKSPENTVFAMGGMVSGWNSRTKLSWKDTNRDAMRPFKSRVVNKSIPNLPHVSNRYAKLGDYIDDFVAGFEDYAKFVLKITQDARHDVLFPDFSRCCVRKIIRPTRFYYLLLRRLKNHRSMHDGVMWSAQVDFLTRLANWEHDPDLFWPLIRAERAALVVLNVPHFVSSCEGREIHDKFGTVVRTQGIPGLHRARARVQDLTEQEISWQVQVIRESASSVSRSVASTTEKWPLLRSESPVKLSQRALLGEADKIAAELSEYAIRRGPGAAWIGLDWLGDSEDSKVCQLITLGPDLYNGVSGIALFLSGHAAVRRCTSSAHLALAAITYLRKSLKGRNAARFARSIGLGGATGLGSIVYALSVMSKLLNDNDLLIDARMAAELFTDDLITADKEFDVIAGSAGAVLGLLRLHRDSPSTDVLTRAIKCGEHLLAQSRVGMQGQRSWYREGAQPLNGMSHGAAGFAYALASLATATGRADFAEAASECIAGENASYDAEQSNWPDFRAGGRSFPCQWCHGATGIGLARIAISRLGGMDKKLLAADITNAITGVGKGAPRQLDTLCCGTLGNIELFYEAGSALGSDDLKRRAWRQLAAVTETAAAAGDYRWNAGSRRFNLGLFRGLAGIGYTMLRRADDSLPNVLIWE